VVPSLTRFASRLGGSWDAAERWLLPGECLVCQQRVGPQDHLICPVCRSRWLPVPTPQCDRCGQPVESGRACRVCPDWPAGFGAVSSAVWLDDAARRVVHLLKYRGWQRVADSLATRMVGLAAVRPGAVLVPIPLGRSRLKERGYNQSARIARALAGMAGARVDEGLLARVRETASQTALTPDQREANLRRAFAAAGPLPERIVLVDDVFTTGATLVSAAKSLLERGVAAVSAVTFARAELPLAAIGRMV